jgi:hypothetical protein
MAAGEASFNTDRIASRQSAANQTLIQSDEGKANPVHTAMWAVGLTVLSNVANIFKQLKDVIESVIQLQRFESVQQLNQLALDHPWISAILLSVVVVCGNVLLFRFLYNRLRQRIPTAYKVLAYAGCVALVAVVLVSNLFSVKSLLHNPVDVQRELVNELVATQDIYGGEFRNLTSPEGVQGDAWTTAQSLDAALLAGTYNPVRIKQGFSYIESQKQNDGFGFRLGPGTAPIVRTESAAWVAVAYLDSLSRPGLWTDSERAASTSRIVNILQMITIQQDRASGGWGPVPHSAASHARTYATMMAVWALTEALLSKDIPPKTKESLGPVFEAGVSWLINHYESNLGWEEDPKYPLGKPFPGLTYQVLFVLERAQLVSGHNSFKDTEAYRRIKRDFRNTIHTAQVGDSASVPTSYMTVGENSCPTDVLSYPWLLAVLPVLVADPDVPSGDRRYLRGVLRDELGKVPELPSALLKAETWQLAEDLIGLSYFINSQRA